MDAHLSRINIYGLARNYEKSSRETFILIAVILGCMVLKGSRTSTNSVNSSSFMTGRFAADICVTMLPTQ